MFLGKNLSFIVHFLNRGTISLTLLLYNLIDEKEILKVYPELTSKCECHIADFNGFLAMILMTENLTAEFFNWK